jgi:hypothetical protein
MLAFLSRSVQIKVTGGKAKSIFAVHIAKLGLITILQNSIYV